MDFKTVIFATYPETSHSHKGSFNSVYVSNISRCSSVAVISLHTWLPGRPFYKKEVINGALIIHVYAPQIPALSSCELLNAKMSSGLVLRALMRCLDISKIRVIHVVGLFNMCALLVSEQLKTPLIVQFIGTDVDRFMLAPARLVERLARVTRRITCNSSSIAVTIGEKCKIFACRPTVIYRGIDPTKMGDRKVIPLEGKRRYLFLGGFPNYIVTTNTEAATFEQRDLKGGLSLVRVWCEALKMGRLGRDARLYVGGPYSEKKFVKTKCELNSDCGTIKIIGAVSHCDALRYINSVDVVIVPSYSEGLPNVAMEAMALGKVVVARAVGGLKELITDKETGYLFSSNDELGNLLSDVDKLSERDLAVLGVSSKRRISESFRNQEMIRQYAAIYCEVENSFPLRTRGTEKI